MKNITKNSYKTNKKLYYKVLNKYDSLIQKILSLKHKNFKNFILPLEMYQEELQFFYSVLSTEHSFIHSKMGNTANKINYDQYLWEVKHFSNQRILDEILLIYANDDLNKEQVQLLTTLLTTFYEFGLIGSDNKANKKEVIDTKIANVESKISFNIATHARKIKLKIKNDKKYNNELGQDWVNKSKKGKFLILDEKNSSEFFIKSADSKNKEKYTNLTNQIATKGKYNNFKNVIELHSLLNKKAKIKGYKSWQDYKTSGLYYKPKFVRSFLMNKLYSLKKESIIEKREIIKFGKSIGVNNFRYWDSSYIIYKMNNQFDDSNFLDLNNIFIGMNVLLKDLIDGKIIKTKKKSINEEIIVYDFYVKNKFYGEIHFDLFDKKWKEGAFATALKSPVSNRRGIVLVSTNIVKNNLKKTDMTNLFHELGHAVHILVTKSNYINRSVIGDPFDLIEIPGMLFQELAMEKNFLSKWLCNKQENRRASKKEIELFTYNPDKCITEKAAIIWSLIDLDVYSNDKLSKNKLIEIEKKWRMNHSSFFSKNDKFKPLLPATSHMFGGGYESTMYVYDIAYFLSNNIVKYLGKDVNDNWKKRFKEFFYNFFIMGSQLSPGERLGRFDLIHQNKKNNTKESWKLDAILLNDFEERI